MTHSNGGGALFYYLHFSHYISHNSTAMLVFLVTLILTLFVVSLPIIIFSLHSTKRYRVYSRNATEKPAQKELLEPGSGSDPAQMTRSSDSPAKLAELLVDEEEEKNKRKKRAKKKMQDETHSGGADGKEEMEMKKKDMFPFTSSSSTIQRKMRNQYEQLAKSHESSGVTLVQFSQFVECLVDAKKELQHRSEVLQRKFTITKALLQKADRSSFDRLHKQIYKLELEQKRLEDDAFVYNWLEQQLKISPAYKKILEISAAIEMTDKPGGREEDSDSSDDFADISFEELLAQEKKDAFWQRHKKIRSN